MSNDRSAPDPMDFMKNLWGQMGFALPGMVTPTLDVGELDRRITDLKAVEGWLKMNHNMLQMTIQGLEVQRATLAAMEAMSQSMRNAQQPVTGDTGESGTSEAPKAPEFNPAALWPWNLVKTEAPEAAAEAESKPKARTSRTAKARKDETS